MTRLSDIARVVRSKNTSPFTYALDIMFRDAADYRTFKERDMVDAALISRLYGLDESEVLDIIYFDPALAIKICLPREVSSRSPGAAVGVRAAGLNPGKPLPAARPRLM